MIPTRLLTKFFAEPWLIRPDVHQAMGAGLVEYLEGRARLPVQLPEGTTIEYAAIAPGTAAFPVGEEALKPVKIDAGFALIDVAGTIGKHLSMLEMLCADGYDIARLENAVVALGRRRDVHTVVFRFNTPGGTASGVGDVAALIRELSADKRTVGYLDVEAASAGYWLAAACQEIYAPSTAVVGSISAYIALLDQGEYMAKKGLKMDVFRDGALKGIGIPGKELSKEERAFLQARVEATGGAFKKSVTEWRPGISRAALDGRWMSGEEALEAGLIDGVVPSVHHLLARLMEERQTRFV